MRTSFIFALDAFQRLHVDIHSLWNGLLVFASIDGFFSNLYGDITLFALAMATFFFAWAAILFMTAGANNERGRTHAQGALYAALGGLALALLAQTIAGLVDAAASGQ